MVVCSDSEAAIGALSSCKVSDKSVLRCKRDLETLAEENVVSMVWVPGHSGVEGNEKADALAREGSQVGSVDLNRRSACMLEPW